MRELARSYRLTCAGAVCAFALLLGSGALAAGQQNATDAVPGAAPPMNFSKVMIYADSRDDGNGFLWWGLPADNAWQFANVSSAKLIANAYGVGVHQVIGLPDWAQSDRYNLVAKLGGDEFDAFEKLPQGEQWKQELRMMQGALADRYQLQAHQETREMPVYELVVADGGPKLPDGNNPVGHNGSSFVQPQDWWNTGTMADLAEKLSGPAGGIVVDKTGLGNKAFRYHLKWTGNELSGAAGGASSISKTLDEQLGLKLVAATVPVQVLVVDHIEKPATGYWQRGVTTADAR